MRALVVTAHPDVDSLVHEAARRVHERLGTDRTAIAHLAQEGFDPRFSLDDRRAYVDGSTPPPARDVAAEQRRVDDVDHLVLVFPVHWWSMPALLKGWIDRVFVRGWAFEIDEDGHLVPALQRLTVHLLPVAGFGEEPFERHGYLRALRTQIEHGIVEYVGARVGATAFVHDSDDLDRTTASARVDAAVATIAAAIERAPAPAAD
jgi:NAD(P)H dehydrogenase (quinone)